MPDDEALGFCGRTPFDAPTFLGVSLFRANYPPLLASPAFRFQCVRLSLFARIQRCEPHTRCIHALAVPKLKAPVSATPGACYSRPVHPKPIRPKTAYDRMGVRSPGSGCVGWRPGLWALRVGDDPTTLWLATRLL